MEEIENGLFVTDYNTLVENSWNILLQKGNKINLQEVK
jgi:hypothetical protein